MGLTHGSEAKRVGEAETGHETKMAKRSPYKRQQTRGQEASEVQTEPLHNGFDGCDQTGWIFVPFMFHFVFRLLLAKLLWLLF